MRAGDDLQYLHRLGCKRYRFWHHALGLVVRWQWADRQPRHKIVAAVLAQDIKICRACLPLGNYRAIRSPR
jgi:hypothetical protein